MEQITTGRTLMIHQTNKFTFYNTSYQCASASSPPLSNNNNPTQPTFTFSNHILNSNKPQQSIAENNNWQRSATLTNEATKQPLHAAPNHLHPSQRSPGANKSAASWHRKSGLKSTAFIHGFVLGCIHSTPALWLWFHGQQSIRQYPWQNMHD